MTLSEKSAYLKGLMEGMKLDTETNEGKLISEIISMLQDVAENVSDLEEVVDCISDELDCIEEDLDNIDDYLMDDDDDEYDDYDEDEDYEDDEDDEEDADDANDDDIASEPFYEVACPACGETVYVSEDDLDAGEAICPSCKVAFEVALADDEEAEEDDGPVQYEVTCPACGKTAVFEEDELLDGAPKCPNCGEPLDFEVTEE